MAVGTRTSARERLLAAADELFYREGIHVVGIDRVIEHAGVGLMRRQLPRMRTAG